MMPALAAACLLCAVVPCVLFCVNLRRYRPPPAVTGAVPAVSILIPARNEAEGIGGALAAALATRGVEFEVVVMDDASTDGTAGIVLAHRDPRIRLERAPALPAGWNGKQHACWALAQAARHPILCFVDADVRLEPDCIARMAGLLTNPPGRVGAGGFSLLNSPSPPTGALAPAPLALVSGFPQQLTGTFLEWLLLPLIHFVLLGFLPLGRMRQGTDPAFAAGCGQFFLCSRDAYFSCGGHSGIKLTMHDGLRLPKLFREHGYRTDLADITALARCRMYTSSGDTWQGLAKNATEGLGAPGRILPISIILLVGQVVPFLLLIVYTLEFLLLWLFIKVFGISYGFTDDSRFHFWFPLAALCFTLLATWLPRVLAIRRFRQDWRSAVLHPLGILLLIAVQWYALFRKLRGGQVSWRGRAYVKTSA